MTPRPQEWIDSVNERRAELNLTLRALADAAGIHKSVMQRAISRDYGASDATVFAIDHALLTASLAKDEAALDQEYSDPATPPNPDDSSTWQHEWTGKPITEPSHTIAALQERTATLAGEQDRFWCDHNEGMKRIAALEAMMKRNNENVELWFANLSKAGADLESKHESLAKDCTAWISDLNHSAKKMRSDLESTVFGERWIEAMRRLTTLEGQIEASDEVWGERATTLEKLKDAHESLTDACTLRIGNLEHHARQVRQDFGEWKAGLSETLDTLNTDLGELRSSYVNRAWGARIEGMVNNIVKMHEHMAECNLQRDHIVADEKSQFEAFRDAANEQIDLLGTAWDTRAESAESRLTAAEHADSQMRECLNDLQRKIGYAEKRITINDGEINNLAKSVDNISRDLQHHQDRLDTHFAAIRDTEVKVSTMDCRIDGVYQIRKCDTEQPSADIHASIVHHARRLDALEQVQQESFYQTANTEAIRRHEKGIHDLDAAITNLVTHANSSDHDNAIAFLELANQQLTSRIAALEARDTEKFAMRVIECLAGRLG